METTAYEIALIAGGFTIVGALIGSLSAYRVAVTIASRNERRSAVAKLRAAFAPALAQIYIAQKHGDHNRPSIDDFVRETLLDVASAIEDFRPFVRNSNAYQEAWERYRQLATEPAESFAADQECGEEGCALANAIGHILSLASP